MAFTRKRPARQPFPEHLPRERVVEPGPATCHCCGSARLRKLGEDITETLEVIPRQWKGIRPRAAAASISFTVATAHTGCRIPSVSIAFNASVSDRPR